MENYDFNDEEMEMPTPCVNCGDVFDLTDGYRSGKWHENTVICEKCHELEEKEIEDDERWEGLNIEISNALYEMDKEPNSWDKLDKENQKIILHIAGWAKKV